MLYHYVGIVKQDPNKVMYFTSPGRKPTHAMRTAFKKVIGPYKHEHEAKDMLTWMKRYGGYQSNPAASEKQRRFMCAELGRKRAGKRTQTGMTERQLRDFCRKNNPSIKHIKDDIYELWSRGRSVSQLAKQYGMAVSQVNQIVDALFNKYKGGLPSPRAHKHNPACACNPKEKVITHKQALALTKKVIAYGKKLFKHEAHGIKYGTNPGEEYHNKRFIRYMRELENYELGSQKYIATLAKAYDQLESAKDSMREFVR